MTFLDNDQIVCRAHDVLDVNAFEIRGNIRALFPFTSMMNASCSPNTQNSIDSNWLCRVRAARDIAKGEEITDTTVRFRCEFRNMPALEEAMPPPPPKPSQAGGKRAAADDGVEATKKSEVTLTREDDYFRSQVDEAEELRTQHRLH